MNKTVLTGLVSIFICSTALADGPGSNSPQYLQMQREQEEINQRHQQEQQKLLQEQNEKQRQIDQKNANLAAWINKNCSYTDHHPSGWIPGHTETTIITDCHTQGGYTDCSPANTATNGSSRYVPGEYASHHYTLSCRNVGAAPAIIKVEKVCSSQVKNEDLVNCPLADRPGMTVHIPRSLCQKISSPNSMLGYQTVNCSMQNVETKLSEITHLCLAQPLFEKNGVFNEVREIPKSFCQ